MQTNICIASTFARKGMQKRSTELGISGKIHSQRAFTRNCSAYGNVIDSEKFDVLNPQPVPRIIFNRRGYRSLRVHLASMASGL